ncbi:cysteine peptidase family C39 domain-containing protein [Pedobacter sp. NJ-S-72]
MKLFNNFPFYKQLNLTDCGSSCLRMICKFHGKEIHHPQYVDSIMPNSREGVSVKNIEDAGIKLGFNVITGNINFHTLSNLAPLPCIIHWKQGHFVVIYKVKSGKVHVSDPAFGKLKYSIAEFMIGWTSRNDLDGKGIAILLEPNSSFNLKHDHLATERKKLSFSFFLQYLYPYKKYYFQLFLSLLLGSVLQMIFPVLTQSIVEIMALLTRILHC